MWSSSTSPCHNFLLLVFSYTCDLLLFVSLPRRYHFVHPCYNRLFTLLISICISLSQSPYPRLGCLINGPIPLLILVTIVSVILLFPLPPCSLLLLVSSIHKYHFPILVAIIFSTCRFHFSYPCCNHSPCLGLLLIFLIRLLLLFIIVGALLHVPPPIVVFFSSSIFLINITLPTLPSSIFSLSGSSSPCTYSFASLCCDCRSASTHCDHLVFASILMPLKHYKKYQEL